MKCEHIHWRLWITATLFMIWLTFYATFYRFVLCSKILFLYIFCIVVDLTVLVRNGGAFLRFLRPIPPPGHITSAPHRAISRCKSPLFQFCLQTFMPPGQLPTDSVLFAVSWWACKIWPNQFNKVRERVKIALISYDFSKLARVP